MNASHSSDAPGVIAIPPLIYLGFLVLGVVLEWLWPSSFLPRTLQYVIGLALISVSAAIAALAVAQFRKANTNLDVRKPATALVVSGPFRYSRNPMYLALTLMYLGVGIVADSAWILGLIVPTLCLMHFGVIRREERYMERKFGGKYRRYKSSVRRWL